MKNCKVSIIFKDADIINMEFTYKFLCEIFGRIDSALILKNKTDNDILKLIIKL